MMSLAVDEMMAVSLRRVSLRSLLGRSGLLFLVVTVSGQLVVDANEANKLPAQINTPTTTAKSSLSSTEFLLKPPFRARRPVQAVSLPEVTKGRGGEGGKAGAKWSEWSEWSACSKQCLPGESQARSRQCLDHQGASVKDTSLCPKKVQSSERSLTNANDVNHTK